MEELSKKIKMLLEEISDAMTKLDIVGKEDELKQLKEQTDYTDYKAAAELHKKEAEFNRRLKVWREDSEDLNEMINFAKLNDTNLLGELEEQYQKILHRFEKRKTDLRFNGPYDDHDVILSIHAGAGGTDAQDWAQMLLRMYVRWAESHNLQVKTIDQSAGEEAGIKSADLEITGGDFLYGKLAGEHGVHRLVRKSPFNSAGSRETSFAKVEVLPLIDQPKDVEIDDKDLRVDVYRAGGHGGQSVNTTDSAVRVTHLPTGITVAIQNERSQLQNKETALNILRSRLAQLQLEQHAETLTDVRGPNQSAEFGNQIRNYILDDRIVKDLRTGYESHDPDKILNGELDPLINAWLEHKPTD